MMSLSLILGSIIFLCFFMYAVQWLARYYHLHAEVARKCIHVGIGLYALSFPWLFTATWQVVITCSLAILLFILIRSLPTLKEGLGAGLYKVGRYSYGELLFALSVILLFPVAQANKILYILPLIILTLSDAAAALVGINYGKNLYLIRKGSKSWEGTTFFLLSSLLLSLLSLILLTEVSRPAIVLIAFIIAIFASLLEAFSWRGLDNLFVPVGVYLLLKHLLNMNSLGLVIILFFLCTMIVTVAIMARYVRFNTHAVFAAILSAFYFWIVAGIYGLLPPAMVFVTHLLLASLDKQKEEMHELGAVLGVVSTGLIWLLFKNIFLMNVYLAFTLGFGLHAAFIIMLRIRQSTILSYWLANIAGITITILPLWLFQPSIHPSFWPWVAVVVWIFVVCNALLIKFNKQFESHRWWKQAFIVLCISGIGLWPNFF